MRQSTWKSWCASCTRVTFVSGCRQTALELWCGLRIRCTAAGSVTHSSSRAVMRWLREVPQVVGCTPRLSNCFQLVLMLLAVPVKAGATTYYLPTRIGPGVFTEA